MSATRPPAFEDRFTTPIEASRRGAHRARPKPLSAGLPVFLGVLVVLLVAFGIYTVVGRNPSDPGSASAAGTTSSTPTPTATGSRGSSGTKPTATKTSGATSSSSTSSSSTSSTTSSATSVNRAIKLVVLNSVSVQGLAKRVQAAIERDGWNVRRTDNSTTRNLSTSKIYYGSTSDQATAEALQQDLGFGETVKDSSVASSGLVVVLGRDAE